MFKPTALKLLLSFYALLGVFTVLFFKGTGDVGDSITHYLFAKSAPLHITLYFDHWAKPLYVLLASPFAQFGFNGIKVFNLINTLFTLWLIYQCAEGLKLKYPIVAVLLAMFSPLYYAHTFSGLTEPLFAMLLALALYFIVRQHPMAAAVVVSFLPYVRSEGLIISGVYLIYFIWHQKWKTMPFLIAGSIVYGIAGYFVYGSIFWVFTKIPYATMSSVYGHGDLMNFVYQLYYVVGVPVYILLGVGLLYVTRYFFTKQLSSEITILVFLGFLAYFIAHTLFWYLGIFNSMGLKRVLLGVMPYIALLGVIGFNFVKEQLFSKIPGFSRIVSGALLVYVVIFPLLPNPAALDVKRDLMLTREQELAIEITNKLKENKLNMPVLYSHFYLSALLDIDHFDPALRVEMDSTVFPVLPSGTKIVWESLYAEKISGLSRYRLDRHPLLIKQYECSGPVQNKEMVWVIYEKQ